MTTHQKFNFRSFARSPIGLVLIAGGAAIGYFLLQNSQVSFDTILPFLFLGGCLLMHLFMPHGHGHDDSSDHDRQDADTERDLTATDNPSTRFDETKQLATSRLVAPRRRIP
ncbi:MAG: DUF2933 domain-containing protein [Rhodospirillaceae bacterium]|nr:DUF2933 domain-containing protein [Rhodospirillaceae bacterium]